MASVLKELGVTHDLLTKDEQTCLRKHGYVNLGKMLSDDELLAITERINALLVEEGEQQGSELFDSPYIRHPKEAGADRLANLVNKGSVFDKFYTDPRLLAAISLVLGQEIRLSSLNYRAAKPGLGAQ